MWTDQDIPLLSEPEELDIVVLAVEVCREAGFDTTPNPEARQYAVAQGDCIRVALGAHQKLCREREWFYHARTAGGWYERYTGLSRAGVWEHRAEIRAAMLAALAATDATVTPLP